MEAHKTYIINYAIETFPKGLKEEDYEDWREKEFNDTFKEVPNDFNVDWCEVLDYIAKTEEDWLGDAVKFEFPLNKKTLYNKLNYLIIMENDSRICHELFNNTLIKDVLNELQRKSFWDESKYKMLIEAVPIDVLNLWCKMYIK